MSQWRLKRFCVSWKRAVESAIVFLVARILVCEIMPILTESMAPLVSSYNQAFRTSSRSREPDDEAPRSKRMCARDIGKVEAGKTTSVDAFRPETPTKIEEPIVKVAGGGWEALELCLLERVTRSLSTPDLCRLAQVIH